MAPETNVKINKNQSVLRIHLILMRIRILDPHWNKMYPNLLNFITKQNLKMVVLFFSLIFMLKLVETFRNQDIF